MRWKGWYRPMILKNKPAVIRVIIALLPNTVYSFDSDVSYYWLMLSFKSISLTLKNTNIFFNFSSTSIDMCPLELFFPNLLTPPYILMSPKFLDSFVLNNIHPWRSAHNACIYHLQNDSHISTVSWTCTNGGISNTKCQNAAHQLLSQTPLLLLYHRVTLSLMPEVRGLF